MPLLGKVDQAKRKLPKGFVHNLNTKIDFGKHKGETLDDVIDTDVRWVRWALDNIEGFHISNPAYVKYERNLEDLHDSENEWPDLDWGDTHH